MEFLAHAKAGVFADELIHRRLVVRGNLFAIHLDAAAGAIVLDGVGGDIHEHTIEVQRAADELAMVEHAGFPSAFEADAVVPRAGFHDAHRFQKELAHLERLILQHQRAGLQFADIQHIIHQVQEIICRVVNLLLALRQFLRVVLALVSDVQHADDAIQRRADVMAHAAQEIRLREIRPLRFYRDGAKTSLQVQLMLFLLCEIARHIEHRFHFAILVAALHDEASHVPAARRILVLQDDGLLMLQPRGQGMKIQKFPHGLPMLGRHEILQHLFHHIIEDAGLAHRLCHKLRPFQKLIGMVLHVGDEDGAVHRSQGVHDLPVPRHFIQCFFQGYIFLQDHLPRPALYAVVVANEKLHHRQEEKENNHRHGCHLEHGALVVSDEAVGIFYIHLDAEDPQDFLVSAIIHGVASREDVSPVRVDDVPGVHRLAGQRPLNIRNHFLFDGVPGISEILGIQVQPVHQINQLAFAISLGRIEIASVIHAADLIQMSLQIFVNRCIFIRRPIDLREILGLHKGSNSRLHGITSADALRHLILQHIFAGGLIQHHSIQRNRQNGQKSHYHHGVRTMTTVAHLLILRHSNPPSQVAAISPTASIESSNDITFMHIIYDMCPPPQVGNWRGVTLSV